MLKTNSVWKVLLYCQGTPAKITTKVIYFNDLLPLLWSQGAEGSISTSITIRTSYSRLVPFSISVLLRRTRCPTFRLPSQLILSIFIGHLLLQWKEPDRRRSWGRARARRIEDRDIPINCLRAIRIRSDSVLPTPQVRRCVKDDIGD